MLTPAERLQAARKAAGFKSKSEAAEAMGVPVASYIQHENGTRGIPKSRAPMYARRFHTTVEWLLFGTGKAPEGPLLPNEEELAMMVEAAQRELPVTASIGDYPRIVASSLREQLERFVADRTSGQDQNALSAHGRVARLPAPTRQSDQAE